MLRIWCALPLWLRDLTPKPLKVRGRVIPENSLWHDAMLSGLLVKEVKVGQVSVDWPAFRTNLQLESKGEVALFNAAAERWWLSIPASVLRTAILLGLPLPRIEEGVMSQTREEPFTEGELIAIRERAKWIRKKLSTLTDEELSSKHWIESLLRART